MFKDIIIGQYVPGNSPLHKMNPPVKIIMTILYIVIVVHFKKSDFICRIYDLHNNINSYKRCTF